jgi:hypothetical protein
MGAGGRGEEAPQPQKIFCTCEGLGRRDMNLFNTDLLGGSCV